MSDHDTAHALDRLERFIGEWEIEAVFPGGAPAGTDDAGARATFEWMLGRQFLVQRSSAPDPIPEAFMIVGVDPERGGYVQHYFDSRNVTRLYAMTFDGTRWTLTRESPDFSPFEFAQRYVGTFEDEGRVIRGAWEIRHPGADWAHDFELIYTKVG
jgi:hypothetical protein